MIEVYLKKAKFRRKIYIQLTIDLVETKVTVYKIITVIWDTCVQKNSEIRTLTKQLRQNIDFSRISRNCPKFHLFTKMIVCKCKNYWNVYDQLLVPDKFHWRSIRGILFFNFARFDPLTPKLKRPRNQGSLNDRSKPDFVYIFSVFKV